MNVYRTTFHSILCMTIWSCGSWPGAATAAPATSADLWDLARARQDFHRFSTLFTAQNVRDLLSTDEGISRAIDWCRKTAVTKVYIECFRDGYQAERGSLMRAKQRFLTAGFDVSGCVTTTGVGKRSTGWTPISCYTDGATQQRLQQIFEYAASLFDEIMIDDFWFTDCQCRECDAARRSRSVKIGDHSYRVGGETWEDYRCELIVRLSRDRVLAAAKRVNPKARLIIKYPQWYDHFHERGYEVLHETADFDRIWVGTETRDYDDPREGGTPQYEGYFIMRWLGGIGGPKCGGGWYDPYGTTERTYVEQARQTVLAGARESMLFCYGSLLEKTGPKNIEALRRNIPELLSVAEEVRRRQIIGIAAYKPVNSHAENEQRVFDFVGMLGLPLVPCHEFPTDAKAAFFSIHAIKDPDLPRKLAGFIAAGKPVLLTDGLAKRLSGKVNLTAANVHIFPVKGDPKSLLELPQTELGAMRAAMLRPLDHAFVAPARVGLYLFSDGSSAIENFRDEVIRAELDGVTRAVPPRGWLLQWKPLSRPISGAANDQKPTAGADAAQRWPAEKAWKWYNQQPNKSDGGKAAGPADHWPQWHGPTRDCRVGGPAWPTSLGKDHLKRLWHVNLGPGYPGPIVAADRVFVAETKDEKTEIVRAIDRETGKELWKAEWPGAMSVAFMAKRNGDWIRSTPAYDGDSLFVGGMRDVLVCLDAKTGKQRWRLDFMERFKTPLPNFGFVCSPLVVGDFVYVQAGAGFCKLDKQTGKVLWRVLTDDGGMFGSAFSSPILTTLGGKPQLVVQTRLKLAGVEPDSGKVLWSQNIPATLGMNIVTPTVDGDRIFTSAYGGGSRLLEIKRTGEDLQVQTVWKTSLQGYMSTPVIIDGHAYLHLRSQKFTCVDLKTGKQTWTTTERYGQYWSLAAQKDRILALDQRGELILIHATPEKFDLLDSSKISDEETWGHLAVCGDQVFVRELNGISVYRWR